MLPIYYFADPLAHIITTMFDKVHEQQLEQMIANKATMGERLPRIPEAILAYMPFPPGATTFSINQICSRMQSKREKSGREGRGGRK